MSEQILDYLIMVLPISLLVMVAIIFSNKRNQETAFEINVLDKLQLKVTAKQHNINQGRIKNTHEILQNKRERIINIANQHGAYNIRIFDSVDRGETNINSDIIFLVDLGEDLSPWFPVRLIRELEQLLGIKVDVVTENGLKNRIRNRVLQEAIPL